MPNDAMRAEPERKPLDSGCLNCGMIVGLGIGALFALLYLPIRGLLPRLIGLGRDVRARLQSDAVAESIAEGKAAAQARRARQQQPTPPPDDAA